MSRVGIALECGTERWRNIVEAAKAPRFHCCLIRRSWGGNCLLEIFPLFHFPQPSVGENLKLIVSWKIFTEKPKALHFFIVFFYDSNAADYFLSQGLLAARFYLFFWGFFLVVFSSAGLSPAQVFILPGQQHLLGFTWIHLFSTSQLLESQSGRMRNKRKKFKCCAFRLFQ